MSRGSSLALAFIGLLVILEPIRGQDHSDTDTIEPGYVKQKTAIFQEMCDLARKSKTTVLQCRQTLIAASISNHSNRSSNDTNQSETISVVISDQKPPKPTVNVAESMVNIAEPTAKAHLQPNAEPAEEQDGIFRKDWKTLCSFYRKHKLLVSSLSAASIMFLVSLTTTCVFLQRRQSRIRQHQRRLGSAIFAVPSDHKKNLTS